MVRYIAENDEDALTLHEPAPAAYLVLVVDGRVSQTFPLRGELELGRDKGNGVVIADQKVSRHHARLQSVEGAFILSDQASANGTYLNGVQITQPTRLKDKDRITIGDATFVFMTSIPASGVIDSPGFSANPVAQAMPRNLAPSVTLGLDHKQLWVLVGCLGLMVVGLLLAVALMLGLFLGSSQVTGALWLINLY